LFLRSDIKLHLCFAKAKEQSVVGNENIK
jgi:hypothetical protein